MLTLHRLAQMCEQNSGRRATVAAGAVPRLAALLALSTKADPGLEHQGFSDQVGSAIPGPARFRPDMKGPRCLGLSCCRAVYI